MTIMPAPSPAVLTPAVQAAQDAWDRLARLLSRQPAQVTHTPLPRPEATLEVRQLSVAPPGQNVATVRGLSFAVPPGQALGVIGPSGAGKSTLIHLIQRLDDVQHGRILLDGQDIRSVSQDSLREKIAVVPQETALFNRSIRENIRYGRPDASDEEVVQAARRAFCDSFIRELPQGYDTLVGERGVMLSGGQRQRLGIARAFLKDAPILILDEATSAIDTHTEQLLQKSLEKLTLGRTTFVVAHRLSTIRNADKIVVMESGRVVEQGSHDQLMAKGGAYARLVALQFGESQ